MDQDGHILDITEDMVVGEEIKDNKLPEYKRNNLLACLNIPVHKKDMGYEELVKFILGHPLSTAFTEGTCFIIPQVLLEFWYTCRVEGSSGEVIRGSVNDGENTVRITPNSLRKVLRLPVLPIYDPEVSRSEGRSVLLEIGNPTAEGVIKKSQFTTKWGFLVSTIVRSLGTKIGSLDNVNDVEMQLLYALVKGRNLDFAQLFFNELKNHVCKKPRDPAAPYSRFVSMCIQDCIGDLCYDGLAEMFETVGTPKLTYKMFSGNIQDDEVQIPSTTRFWINNPFQPASSSSSHSASGTDSSTSSSSSSEGMNEHNPPSPHVSSTQQPVYYSRGTAFRNPIFHEVDVTLTPSHSPVRVQGEHSMPTASVAATCSTSLATAPRGEIKEMLQELLKTVKEQQSSSQQSPIPAPSELTREVRVLALAFQSYKNVQDNRYADMQNEMSRTRSVQESLQKAVQDLKDHIPCTFDLTESMKIIKDNTLSVDMTMQESLNLLVRHLKDDREYKEKLIQDISVARGEFELQKKSFEFDANMTRDAKLHYQESRRLFDELLHKLNEVAKAFLLKSKDDDDDKKGESTKRRRESDDDPEEGEIGYENCKRTKSQGERKIIDLNEEEETQPTQPQPPEQLSQADPANVQLVQIQPPEEQPRISPGKEIALQSDSHDDQPISKMLKRRKGSVDSDSEEAALTLISVFSRC